MRHLFLIFAFSACSLISLAQTASDKAASSVRLLLSENAYNPQPSPNGQYIAYVGTGWGDGLTFSLGRSSFQSSVGLMDASGIVLNPDLAPGKFLAGWKWGLRGGGMLPRSVLRNSDPRRSGLERRAIAST